MCSIKTFIVFAMAAFYLAIVSGSKWTNKLMVYTMLLESDLKDGGFIRTAMRTKAFSEFLSVVGLNAFNRARKCLYKVL